MHGSLGGLRAVKAGKHPRGEVVRGQASAGSGHDVPGGGYLVAPASLVPALERSIRSTTWNTTTLAVEIACRWLDDGTVDRLEVQKRRDARARQLLAERALTGLPHVGHPTSYMTWLPLPQDARADRIAADLAAQHISVSTAAPFSTTTHVPQAIRLALASAELAQLPAALRTVAEVVEQDRYR